MEPRDQTTEIRVDTYTRVCLTMIAVLLTVLIIGLWAEGGNLARPAGADENTAADTAKELLAAQEKTNQNLQQMIAVLKSGEVRVLVIKRPINKDEGGSKGGRGY